MFFIQFQPTGRIKQLSRPILIGIAETTQDEEVRQQLADSWSDWDIAPKLFIRMSPTNEALTLDIRSWLNRIRSRVAAKALDDTVTLGPQDGALFLDKDSATGFETYEVRFYFVFSRFVLYNVYSRSFLFGSPRLN